MVNTQDNGLIEVSSSMRLARPGGPEEVEGDAADMAQAALLFSNCYPGRRRHPAPIRQESSGPKWKPDN